ncbi:MAG: hypothetical protein HY247_06065 [archaeon]|nr:MAG: hypothetical protein HY247_06065 [archaeon]
MASTNKDKTRVAALLVRKGATILGQACPQCGGIQVRYKGKVYCTSHEDLSQVAKTESVSFDTVAAGMKEVLLTKLAEASAALGSEGDVAKQEQLVSLMAKYFELLSRLPKN